MWFSSPCFLNMDPILKVWYSLLGMLVFALIRLQFFLAYIIGDFRVLAEVFLCDSPSNKLADAMHMVDTFSRFLMVPFNSQRMRNCAKWSVNTSLEEEQRSLKMLISWWQALLFFVTLFPWWWRLFYWSWLLSNVRRIQLTMLFLAHLQNSPPFLLHIHFRQVLSFLSLTIKVWMGNVFINCSYGRFVKNMWSYFLMNAIIFLPGHSNSIAGIPQITYCILINQSIQSKRRDAFNTS